MTTTTSSIQTRLATLADLEAVAQLFDAYRQFYEQVPDLALARRFIHARMQANESVILVAINKAAINEAEQIIGFCQMYPIFCSIEAKPIYSLSDLFVAPDARKSGAGRALLQAAEIYSSEHGRVRLELTTAKTNTIAQAAYESLGWIRDDIYYAYSKRI